MPSLTKNLFLWQAGQALRRPSFRAETFLTTSYGAGSLGRDCTSKRPNTHTVKRPHPKTLEPDCLFRQEAIAAQSPKEEEIIGRFGSLHFY